MYLLSPCRPQVQPQCVIIRACTHAVNCAICIRSRAVQPNENASVQIGNTGGSRNLFWGGQTKVPNRKLRAKPESRARSARVSRAKLESRARSARELRAKPESRVKPEKKAGGGVWGGGSVSPPEIFWKIKLETIHFGAYLKQLFEMTNEMV